MTDTQRADGRRTATRARLLEGALRILAAEGYEAATTGRIAETASIQQPSFYRHFESRDACLAEAIRDAGGALAQRLADRRASLDPAAARTRDPLQREGFMLALSHLTTHRDVARVLLALHDDEHAAGEATREVLALLRDELVADLPRLGVCPVPEDAPMRVEMIFAMVAQGAAGIRRGNYELGEVADLLAEQARHLFG